MISWCSWGTLKSRFFWYPLGFVADVGRLEVPLWTIVIGCWTSAVPRAGNGKSCIVRAPEGPEGWK